MNEEDNKNNEEHDINEPIGDLGDDVEYQFEDDSQLDDSDYGSDDDAISAQPGSKASLMSGPAKPLIIGVGVIAMIAIVYFMMGGQANPLAEDTNAEQFVFADAKPATTIKPASTSPFDGVAPTQTADDESSKASVQDSFLAELDKKPAAGKEKDTLADMKEKPAEERHAMKDEKEKKKAPEVVVKQMPPEVTKKDLQNQIGTVRTDLRKDIQAALGDAVNKLREEDDRSRQDLTKRFEDEVSKLHEQNQIGLARIDELGKELHNLRTKLAETERELSVTRKNQNSIMYNQGMSFNASGEAMTRVGYGAPTTQTMSDAKSDFKYVVQAAVPGRVWLLSDTGATMTATVGDKVPGAGVVIAIDSIKGVVTTSSGKMLTY